jgi:5-methylcytosine-specific restriction endonuclease McrA
MPRPPSPNQTPEQAKRAAYQREWLAKHPEQRKKAVQRAAAWAAAHPEEMKAAHKASAERHPETLPRARKRWYEEHKDTPEYKKWNAAKTARRLREHPEINRENVRRRKLIKRGVLVDKDITPLGVAERDHWVCGICGQPVEPDCLWPDRRGRTIDHIVPLHPWWGGKEQWSNVHLAHFECNIRKNHWLNAFLREVLPSGEFKAARLYDPRKLA